MSTPGLLGSRLSQHDLKEKHRPSFQSVSHSGLVPRQKGERESFWRQTPTSQFLTSLLRGLVFWMKVIFLYILVTPSHLAPAQVSLMGSVTTYQALLLTLCPVCCLMHASTDVKRNSSLFPHLRFFPYSSLLLFQWMVQPVTKLIKSETSRFHVSRDYVCFYWGTILCLAQSLDHVLWKVLRTMCWLNE